MTRPHDVEPSALTLLRSGPRPGRGYRRKTVLTFLFAGVVGAEPSIDKPSI